jgi:hypothetical protein
MTRRKVDLLDPEQEPTDEDFADLMKGFIEDVMATNEIAKRNLDGLMRRPSSGLKRTFDGYS